MTISYRNIVILVLTVSFVSGIAGFGIKNAAAQGLRDKIRERIRERLAERLKAMPPPQTNATATEKLTAPGDYTIGIDYGGLKRYYKIHVPASYDPAKPAPLLFAFHGGTGDMSFQSNDAHYGLITASEKDGFIAVFPNGYSPYASGKIATWNAGNCCGAARDKHIDDVGFTRQMIRNIEGQLNIDTSRIFATGMSNGGMMVHRLACEMPDVFKAVASVAGTDNTVTCNPTRPISVMVIHAKNDDHVLFNGGAGPKAFQDRSQVNDFTSVPETVSRWVKRDRCDPVPKRVLQNAGAYCDRYDQCADNTQVELCVTATGGHSWPGGGVTRRSRPSKALSADDVMWKFFMSQK